MLIYDILSWVDDIMSWDGWTQSTIPVVTITYSLDVDDAAAAPAGDWQLGDAKDVDESVQICDSFLQQK